MKISTRSWHYRFNAKIQQDKFIDRVKCNRHTTCSYIRTTIYSAFQGLWFIFIMCLIVLLAGSLVGSAVWVPISILFLSGTPTGIVLALAVIVWVLIAFGLAVLTWKFMKHRFTQREPNLFVQAIKDHHGKFCTRVEVV